MEKLLGTIFSATEKIPDKEKTLMIIEFEEAAMDIWYRAQMGSDYTSQRRRK